MTPLDIVATCDDCGFEDRRPAEARVVAPDGWDTRYEGMGSLRRLRCSECVSAIRAAKDRAEEQAVAEAIAARRAAVAGAQEASRA